MTPIIGYSSTRVNSIDSSQQKDEYGRWLTSSNFQRIKTIGQNQATDNRNRQGSFATLLKQAEQDNSPKNKIELKPNSLNLSVDILA